MKKQTVVETIILGTGSKVLSEGLSKLDKSSVYHLNPSDINIFLKIIRHLHKISNAKFFFETWFLNKLKLHREIKNIIIFDSSLWLYISSDLKKWFPHVNMVYYYWNPIKDPTEIKTLKKLNYKISTFDKKDSLKYSISYCHQFYWPSKEIKNNLKPNIDFVFVGQTKNRLRTIENLILLIKREKLKFKFHVKTTNSAHKSQHLKLKNKFLEYDEYKVLINQSKCIVDITQENQNGLTLRPLEAIYFRKKLLTTNTSIESFNFFDSSYIYILDKDISKRTLTEFLEEKPIFPSEYIISEYDVGKWYDKILNQ